MAITYEILKRLEGTEDFMELLNKGIIPLSVFDKKVYYEFFKKEMKQTKRKAQAIANTAEEYKVSEMTIRRALNFMTE